MARGWHYTKLSLSSALLLSFSGMCFVFKRKIRTHLDLLSIVIVPFFLSFLFCFVTFFVFVFDSALVGGAL